MSRERYFVVGLAKTGTTAVATTLCNTLRVPTLLMEPSTVAAVAEADPVERLVVKIIFDHWRAEAEALKRVVRPSASDAPLTIMLVRDPRDEAVSRLHYAAYDYFSTRPTTQYDCDAWLEIFHRKEAAPEHTDVLHMQSRIMSRFGAGFLAAPGLHEAYSRFIDDLTPQAGGTIHLLRYEDFVEGTIADETLRKLLSGKRDVGPQLRRVHRHGSSGDWQHYLTDGDLAIFHKIYEPYLRRFGYSLERSSDPAKPDRATGSDYVAKLIDEARNNFKKGYPAGASQG